jgi:predicted DNA binding CopG/RHH family protein
MKKKITYTEGEIGTFERVKDFLPPPSELVRREKNIKITINLRESSVGFFKDVAKKNHIQYQKVIRSLLDSYADTYTKTR